MKKKIIQSAQILEFGNHGNSKNDIKAIFDANKEGSKENIGFGEFILYNCGFHGNKLIESA